MKQIELHELSNYTTQARGLVNRIYLHWSAGRYGQLFNDYHINIDADGEIYIDGELTDRKNHTWRRNTGAVGISLCCCYKAEPEYAYGEYPPTDAQIDTMAKVIAKLCIEIGLYLDSAVWTHAEIADADGYGLYDSDPDCRWDLYGRGDEIRELARGYINEWTNT